MPPCCASTRANGSNGGTRTSAGIVGYSAAADCVPDRNSHKKDEEQWQPHPQQQQQPQQRKTMMSSSSCRKFGLALLFITDADGTVGLPATRLEDHTSAEIQCLQCVYYQKQKGQSLVTGGGSGETTKADPRHDDDEELIHNQYRNAGPKCSDKRHSTIRKS